MHSKDHRGWAWHPGIGDLSWSNLDGRLRASSLTDDERIVSETGQYPAWSPDGEYLGYVSGPTELLLDWFINRRRGSDAWVVRTSDPLWTRRLVTDVTWGEWQPR